MKRLTIARDTGASEILTKPLSAKVLGERMQHALDNQREFVKTDAFAGPDRRRRAANPPSAERRGPR